MISLDIRCPRCSRKRLLTINKEEVKVKTSGLVSIKIDKNFTCEHSYVAYIDQHYIIRDYFDFDYSLELPEMISEKEKEIYKSELAVSFDFDLIKLNISPNILTIIFKAIISRIPCVWRDKDILYDYIIPFFKTINEEAFEFELEHISEEIYNNSKSEFKKSIVVNSTTVIKNPYKFMDIKKLKIEKKIINAFLVELNTHTGLKIIKKHAKIAFDLAGIVCDYVKNHVKEKHIYSKNILDYLEGTHKITVSPQYLDFLIEIVNHYFEIPVKLSMSHYSGVF